MTNQIPTGLGWLISYLMHNYPMTDDLNDAIKQAIEMQYMSQTFDFSQN